MNEFESFNEVDIMDKLKDKKFSLDPISGEINCLKELNSLGKKKIITDPCYSDKKSTKCKYKIITTNYSTINKNRKNYIFPDYNFEYIIVYMITALQKLLKKSTDATTKAGVEEYVITYVITT